MGALRFDEGQGRIVGENFAAGIGGKMGWVRFREGGRRDHILGCYCSGGRVGIG